MGRHKRDAKVLTCIEVKLGDHIFRVDVDKRNKIIDRKNTLKRLKAELDLYKMNKTTVTNKKIDLIHQTTEKTNDSSIIPNIDEKTKIIMTDEEANGFVEKPKQVFTKRQVVRHVIQSSKTTYEIPPVKTGNVDLILPPTMTCEQQQLMKRPITKRYRFPSQIPKYIDK